MKLLTVTIPCYNSENYMEKCIKSLLLGGDRIQIVIIDDGSKDSTGEIADRYAAQYPDIVTVVHQENGGHGEGINQGLKYAEGKYFKVVDSDDWVSTEFVDFLNALEKCEKKGGIDLLVTNYYYEHADGKGNRSICYANALPEDRIFTWSDTRMFQIHQLLTIHSCTFRTELLRQHTRSLPKHVFYEDNLMVYQGLPFVKKMYYMNIDLYRYFIGRDGQSVQRDVMTRRYMHQVEVTERCFDACHLDEIQDVKQKRYLKHELFMMLAISVIYCRLNDTDEADANMEKMWDTMREYDAKWANHFRQRTILYLLCIPGKTGRSFANKLYSFANKVVRFN